MPNYPLTYLKDYRPPPYVVDNIDLVFTLDEAFSTVTTQLQIRATSQENLSLKLQGQGLTLMAISLDGKILSPDEYQLSPEELIITAPGSQFSLSTTVQVRPQSNHTLMGLYKTNGNFCTQCEAEGFRKITYYIDRPDNLALFTSTIIADKSLYPILLSNGNLVGGGDLAAGKHWVKWQDPFKKAGHLFALVAGDLECLADEFTTQSGRTVALQLFVERGNLAKTAYAMQALKHAMRWDEEVYGREYDLDIFMLVAVADFNMGAMENKGLNIFNSQYILASAETATDVDFENIMRVVGHEYFHNWSGNRVGCRDWFQLSLKEGFTVFRDQSFIADMTSAAVKRIEDVDFLRLMQFSEDAGPLAHAVRPESYLEISNFYTATIYEKGAELIHMLHTLLGVKQFRQATDRYFSRFDGHAVTTDDWLDCLQEVSGLDLEQFRLWYSQAGTPVLQVRDEYDASTQQYCLYIEQHTAATAGQTEKSPLMIPLDIALLDAQGKELTTQLLILTQAQQSWVFKQIASRPVPSLLRNFSAPVKLQYAYSNTQLTLLSVHEQDAFSRWEAVQLLAVRQLQALVDALQKQQPLRIEAHYIALYQQLLQTTVEPAFKALLLTLPTQRYLTELMTPIDPHAIAQAHTYLRSELAQQLSAQWLELYHSQHEQGPYQHNKLANGKRALKNVALSYIGTINTPAYASLVYQQYQWADNMTDRFAAFELLMQLDTALRHTASADFYERFKQAPLVVNKWFAAQAVSCLPGALQRVQALWQHPAFDANNPNKVRALIASFSQHNLTHFHQCDGAAYRYLADIVLHLDSFNPQIAARLVQPLTQWQRYQALYATLMQAQLHRLLAMKLSKDTYEIVVKALLV